MGWTTEARVLPSDAEESFLPTAAPLVLFMELGSGSVVVQRRASDGDWETFITPTGTEQVLDVANSPAIRIAVTGDAKFRVGWA